MNDTRQQWDEVGRRFDTLARKLKLHYEQNTGEADRAELDTALRRLGDTVDQGVRSIADAARDPEVREDADRLATALGGALDRTFGELSDQLRAAFEHNHHDRQLKE
jgi:hypothetical protein